MQLTLEEMSFKSPYENLALAVVKQALEDYERATVSLASLYGTSSQKRVEALLEAMENAEKEYKKVKKERDKLGVRWRVLSHNPVVHKFVNSTLFDWMYEDPNVIEYTEVRRKCDELDRELAEIKNDISMYRKRINSFKKDTLTWYQAEKMYTDCMLFFTSKDFQMYNYDNSIRIQKIVERLDHETGFDILKLKYKNDCHFKTNWRWPIDVSAAV